MELREGDLIVTLGNESLQPGQSIISGSGLMINFSLEKPVILVVGIIIVCLFGLAALFRVPIQLIPDLDPRVITVQTIWPGASPQDIEKEIHDRAGRVPAQHVTGLDRMISTAEFGQWQQSSWNFPLAWTSMRR